MPMTCFIMKEPANGFTENGSITRTLSSAIASNLAKGFPMDVSVERAKAYISGALAAMLDLGKGSGPMNHGFDITGEYVKEVQDHE